MLNVGPRPTPASPGRAPRTESTSLNTSRAEVKNAFSLALNPANGPPAPAAPPRGPGSVWAIQIADASNIPARDLTPFLASEDFKRCIDRLLFKLLLHTLRKDTGIQWVTGGSRSQVEWSCVGCHLPGIRETAPAPQRGPNLLDSSEDGLSMQRGHD